MVFLDELESNVKAVKPDSAFVLVYSLGDEMYKWTRMCSLLRPFAQRVEELGHMVGVIAHSNMGNYAWWPTCVA